MASLPSWITFDEPTTPPKRIQSFDRPLAPRKSRKQRSSAAESEICWDEGTNTNTNSLVWWYHCQNDQWDMVRDYLRQSLEKKRNISQEIHNCLFHQCDDGPISAFPDTIDVPSHHGLREQILDAVLEGDFTEQTHEKSDIVKLLMKGWNPRQDYTASMLLLAIRNESIPTRVVRELLLHSASFLSMASEEASICSKNEHVEFRIHRPKHPHDELCRMIHSPSSVRRAIALLPIFSTTTTPYWCYSKSALLSLLSSGKSEKEDDGDYTSTILHAAEQLLQLDGRGIIDTVSDVTGCSALHWAVRNFNNSLDLVKLLVNANPELVHHRNHYGDLPIHVACATGVSIGILEFLLQAMEPEQIQSRNGNEHNPGNTLIELEWIRHIEGPSSWFSPRHIHPVQLPRSKSSHRRQNHQCQELLDRVVKGSDFKHIHATFLERIRLILRYGSQSVCCRGSVLDVHRLCLWSSPKGSSLPPSLSDFFIREQGGSLERLKDEMGRLPIHCILVSTNFYNHVQHSADSAEWIRLAWKILRINRGGCSVPDKSGRYPLHYAVLFRVGDDQRIRSDFSKLVHEIAAAYAGAAMIRDPQTDLFPWQTVAINPSLSLNSIYWLVRRCPDLIEPQPKTGYQ